MVIHVAKVVLMQRSKESRRYGVALPGSCISGGRKRTSWRNVKYSGSLRSKSLARARHRSLIGSGSDDDADAIVVFVGAHNIASLVCVAWSVYIFAAS